MSKDDKEIAKKPPTLVKSAQKFLKKLYRKKIPYSYKFHRYGYFREVVKNAKKMASNLGLSEEEQEILLLAVWFQFSGMTKRYSGYQEISATIATDFLAAKAYPPEKIDRVKALILNVKEGNDVKGKLEEIMHDATVAYRGKKDFSNKSTLLRVELEEVNKSIIKDKVWAEKQFELLTNTTFHSTYASEKYQNGLADNIENQRKKIDKAKKASVRKKTGKDFGRGIDTLYRTSYRNHINLSSIADGKANMMISVNTIIISAIVTLVGASLTISNTYTFEHVRFFVPIIILLLFVLASAVFAIISARPEVTKGNITTEDIIKRNKSILFFGNFITMPKQDFIENLDMLKRNQSLLYDNMSVDMYNLGVVLSRKYKLVKYSYNIFMAGLILSVLTFLVILFYTQIRGI